MRSYHKQFVEKVLGYFNLYGRNLTWRRLNSNGDIHAYRVMVSEIMLQQTQVKRVEPKFKEFMRAFPTVQSVAEAHLSDVLRLWSGLGYNRRAKFLHQAANKIVSEYGGVIPDEINKLVALPGIGHNTAAAILTYSCNQRHVFIETNTRTVYIYHFFGNQTTVDDKQLLPLIEESLDYIEATTGNFREWYWALMDYGTFLKSTTGNPSRASKHYAKQSKFEGSKRQIRGQVIRLLLQGSYRLKELEANLADNRLKAVLSDLVSEGIVIIDGDTVRLA